MEDPQPTPPPPRQLYEIRGDPTAALEAYERLWDEGKEPSKSGASGDGKLRGERRGKQQKAASQTSSPADAAAQRAREYNGAVLSFLSSVGSGAAKGAKSAALPPAPPPSAPPPSTTEGKKAPPPCGGDVDDAETAVAAAHNAALSLLSQNRPREAAAALAGLFVEAAFGTADSGDGGGGGEDVDGAALCPCAFLLLDCLMASSLGDAAGMACASVSVPSAAAKAAEAAGAVIEGGEAGNAKEGSADVKLTVTVDFLLSWIESFLEAVKADPAAAGVGEGGAGASPTEQLRFRLHLYKSRALFLRQPDSQPPTSAMRHDVKTRMARKELKSAMEIFQHKLNRWPQEDAKAPPPTGKDEVSVAAGSVGSALSDGTSVKKSEAGTRAVTPAASGSGVATPPPRYVATRLDAQFQCALSLKANLEYLKGNPRKALKLCAEAKFAGERRRDAGGGEEAAKTGKEGEASGPSATGIAVDLAIHHNNLALIHHASGRYHAALRYYAMALSYIETLPTSSAAPAAAFERDGTVLPVPTAEVLHNASLCAYAAHNYPCAYECMARCVGVGPETYGERGRCWFRMAEGCIGIHADLRRRRRREDASADNSGVALRRDPTTDGVVIDVSSAEDPRRTTTTTASAELAPVLGSPEDLAQVSSDPLPRALFCLQRALRLCQSGIGGEPSAAADVDCLESTAVLLAYVYMELNDPMAALAMTGRILDDDGGGGSGEERNDRGRADAMSLRRRATAKLYACEALCLLNEPDKALRVLLGEDGGTSKDGEQPTTGGVRRTSVDALDRLAGQLAMVPSAEEKTREESGSGADGSSAWRQGRLEDARSAVHVAASGCAACVGDLRAARAHAVHAVGERGLEEVTQFGSGTEAAGNRAQARRALLYCLLREGDCEGAVKLLRAGR